MRLCLGFDPGPTKTGWALIDSDNDGPAIFIKAGVCKSDLASLQSIVVESGAKVVTIEQPVWMGLGHLGKPLINTSFVAGLIYALAASVISATRTVSVRDWRRVLCGQRRGVANDNDVKTVCQRIFGESMPKRSNNHVRDAACIAYYGSTL